MNYGKVKLIKLFLKNVKKQDTNLNHIKFEVNDTYRKDKNITTNFEAVNDEDVINNV